MSDNIASAGPRPLSLNVNGETVHTSASLKDTVLTVLRERLQLTAAKRGCNQGVCGACTILVDGKPTRACLCLAQEAAGAEIRTLEGLNEAQRMQVLQASFAENGAFQCGFCTPGMLVSANALLASNPQPDEAAIRSALSGNLCRCTGYVSIVAAVQSAAAKLRLGGVA
jgi:aerobic-type carbon monoxide dehydrogenase small subunit (CoxS/CutS family)